MLTSPRFTQHLPKPSNVSTMVWKSSLHSNDFILGIWDLLMETPEFVIVNYVRFLSQHAYASFNYSCSASYQLRLAILSISLLSYKERITTERSCTNYITVNNRSLQLEINTYTCRIVQHFIFVFSVYFMYVRNK